MNLLKPVDAIVTDVKQEAPDTRTFTLEPKEQMPAADPGQFNLVGLPGVGEVPITFSAIDGERFAHTIRTVGRVTEVLYKLEPGESMQVRGPYGTGWPWAALKGRDLVVCAGGMGMVPLRPLLHRIVRQRGQVGRLLILYGAREPGQMLYRDEVLEWASIEGTEVRLTVDEVPAGADWEGRTGVVTSLLDHPSAGVPARVALLCGPELMMRFAVRELLLRGMPAGEIYCSLERHMKCGVGHCGHCQLGPYYVCRDGPVFSFSDIRRMPDIML